MRMQCEMKLEAIRYISVDGSGFCSAPHYEDFDASHLSLGIQMWL